MNCRQKYLQKIFKAIVFGIRNSLNDIDQQN